jgi:hypothetical protein
MFVAGKNFHGAPVGEVRDIIPHSKAIKRKIFSNPSPLVAVRQVTRKVGGSSGKNANIPDIISPAKFNN